MWQGNTEEHLLQWDARMQLCCPCTERRWGMCSDLIDVTNEEMWLMLRHKREPLASGPVEMYGHESTVQAELLVEPVEIVV